MREAQATAAVLTFTLHMIPGGALADYLKQGEYGEAAISFVGDVGLLFFALAKIPKFAKYAWALNRAGVATELAVGGARVTQAVGDIIEGDYVVAAGNLGEAFLRLIGVTYGVAKRLTARAPRRAGAPPRARRAVAQAKRTAKQAAPRGIFGKSVDDLSQAGRALDPADKAGQFTKAGRSLTKHQAGARAGSTKFPKAKGNPAAINKQTQDVLDDILRDPSSTFRKGHGGRFGDTIEVTARDGRGVVFDSDGNFLFFKE